MSTSGVGGKEAERETVEPPEQHDESSNYLDSDQVVPKGKCRRINSSDSQEGAGVTNCVEEPGGRIIASVRELPKLIVLDLDKTLWPLYCHEQTRGPYRRNPGSEDGVECRSPGGADKVVHLFPEVLGVLRSLKQQGSIRLAVASRSPEDTAARGILGALGLWELFCWREIHRGSKVTHFKRITKVTRVSYRDMLFFDDDDINIQAVSQLGVCCTRVDKDTGLNFRALQCGLRHYEQTCSSRATMMAWLGSSREPSQAKEDTGNRKPSAESGVRTKPT